MSRKVSVICLSYGRISQLEESIFSFLQQDYDNKEMIIVNDYDKINLIYDNPIIKIINLKKRFNSIGEKRNFAVSISGGDIIIPLDDDDILLSKYITRCVNTLNKKEGHDWIFPHAALLYNSEIGTIQKSGGLTMNTVVFTKNAWEKIKYPEINFDENGIHWRLMQSSNIKGIQSPIDIKTEGYLCGWDGSMKNTYHSQLYGKINENSVLIETKKFLDSKVNIIGDVILNPKWNIDYHSLISDFKIVSSNAIVTSNSPTSLGWMSVKNTWQKATSLIESISSRGIIPAVGQMIGIDNSVGEKVDDIIYQQRKLSCFGSKTSAACSVLKRGENNHWMCGACGCGDNKIAYLDEVSGSYSKLMYPHLECPLKKPGFSNYKPILDDSLSIIIPVLNDNEEANLTIESIRNTTSDKNIEIIVIDDGSDIPVILNDKNVKLFRFNDRLGAGQARHYGAQQAKSKHLLFIDSHMRFDDNWFDNTISRMSNNPKTLWCCSCLGLDSKHMNVKNPVGVYTGADLVLYKESTNTIFDGVWRPDDQSKDDYEISCVMGACYFIHKDWYFHIKGLGQTMMWGSEEPILSIKTWLAGGEVRLMKSVRLGHKFRDASSYVTDVSHIWYNKIAYMYMLLPADMYEKILSKFVNDGNKIAALQLVEKNKQQLDSEREYYKSIFIHDIQWLCDKFKIEMPK